MRSVMSHQFSMVPKANIERSSFDRSHGYKTTFDAGFLIPVYVDEALPGDTFNLDMSGFARLSTPIKPLMDNLYLDTFFFAVPIRLIWDNFKRFMGERNSPADVTAFNVPYIVGPGAPGIVVGHLSDFMGIPTGIASIQFNSLWHRSYNLIWNEFFRDQNLQNPAVVDHDDGPDTYTDYSLLRRGKRHDYFTSCLPWPQKAADVTIPLGTTAPVIPKPGETIGIIGASGDVNTHQISMDGGNNLAYESPSLAGQYAKFVRSGLLTDLSTATAQTINALRQAFQLQKLYERDARGGTRYTEIVRSHFGVVSPDARMQRPEYLGGSTSKVNVHPVPQTSVTGTTPQGNLAGFGTVSFQGHGFTKSFTEHCVLLGLVSVRADLTYQQGLDRMFSRRTRFDFYWPALSHLGEQAVLNKEIYCDGSSHDAEVFGYQERWAEYRYKPSKITGKFRSTYSTPLDMWHLSQKFTALPTLGDVFIQDTPPIDRVIAVNTEPHFLFDSYFNLKCARPMPVYSVPGLIDHF